MDVSPPKRRRISFAQLNDFDKCPKLFFWKHVEHRKPAVYKVSPALVVGGLLHNTLRDCFKELAPEERTAEGLEQALRRRWRDHPQRDLAFASRDEERIAGLNAINILRWFARQDDLLTEPLAVESSCTALIDDGVELVGRIDRIDELPDGRLTVTDYKTGKVPFRFEPRQLLIYALVATDTIGRPVESARFLYLEHGIIKQVAPTAKEIEEIRETVRMDVLRIDSEIDYLPRTSKLCHYCDYLSECDEGRQADAEFWQPEQDDS